MKNEKIIATFILVMTCLICILIWAMNLNTHNLKLEAMKAGLEECPQEPYSHYIENRIIWVKSCTEYMKIYREGNLLK